MKHNLRTERNRQVVRAVVDFGMVMGLIWLISLGTTVHHGEAFILFSMTVATVATLDLAFVRHLRRAYAPPRRGTRRRT